MRTCKDLSKVERAFWSLKTVDLKVRPIYHWTSDRVRAHVRYEALGNFAKDHSPDIEWIEHLLRELERAGRKYDCFGILRPTSPFRLPSTIRRAWAAFTAELGADSLRAVERCSQHPGKIWVIRGKRLLPLLPFGPPEQPWHSTPMQALPAVYVQNASLEIAWTRVVLEGRTIAGETIVPFVTESLEGFDINQPEDWDQAEILVGRGEAKLPEVGEGEV